MHFLDPTACVAEDILPENRSVQISSQPKWSVILDNLIITIILLSDFQGRLLSKNSTVEKSIGFISDACMIEYDKPRPLHR